jgi:glycosyltransferase involved in cell wall biosynthesis
VCAILPKLLGSKVVLDVHDTMPELYRDKFGGTRGAAGARLLMLEERMSSWWADSVLAVHEPHGERLRQAGIRASKIHVVMNAPDTRIFVARKNGNGRSHGFTVVCHGTVTARLGLELLIAAVAALRSKIPGLRLRVIGDGDSLSGARNLVNQLEIGNQVDFMKLVPVEQLPALLATADVGVVPYRPSSATHLMLPVKLLDYATIGIPVIAARLRTIEHYFGDGGVEFFEPGNCEDLARAIMRLYLDPPLRERLVDRARVALNALSWESQKSEYLRTIDALVLRNRGALAAEKSFNEEIS